MNDTLVLKPWGNSVELEKAPFLVRFSGDGRFALCNSMYCGADIGTSPRGAVSCIRIAALQKPDGAVVHQLVSHSETGYGPEGMAVSPDGHYVVTANLEQSFEPSGSSRQTFFASITLLRLDTAGYLDRVGDAQKLCIVMKNCDDRYTLKGFARVDESATFGLSHKIYCTGGDGQLLSLVDAAKSRPIQKRNFSF